MADDSDKYSDKNFNALKIKGSKPFAASTNARARNVWYADGSDTYANQGFTIGFQYEPAGNKKQVYFKAFITAFNETYSCDWAQEQVYGRADPIVLWKSTNRNITMAFKIPCATAGEGYENLVKLQRLIKFLYPVYTMVNKAQTVAQSPMIRMRFLNMSQAINRTKGADFANYFYQSDADNGVLGIIKNLSINHNLESPEGGAIEHAGLDGKADGRSVLPKFIDVNLDFLPIHEHPLGWEKNGEVYSFGMSKDSVRPQSMVGSDNTELPFPYGAAEKADTWRTHEQLLSVQQESANKIREVEETMKKNQQQADNARARYGGVLGKARLKRDERRIGRYQSEGFQADMAGNDEKAAEIFEDAALLQNYVEGLDYDV